MTKTRTGIRTSRISALKIQKMPNDKRLTENEALLFLHLLEQAEGDLQQAFDDASEKVFDEDSEHTSFEEKWGAPASQVWTEQSRRKLRQFVEHAHLSDIDDLEARLAAIRTANRPKHTTEEGAELESALDGLIAAADYADAIGEDELSARISSCYQELAEIAPKDHWNDLPTCSVCGAENPRYHFGRMELPDLESGGDYEETGDDVEGHDVVTWTGDYVEYDYWECEECYPDIESEQSETTEDV